MKNWFEIAGLLLSGGLVSELAKTLFGKRKNRAESAEVEIRNDRSVGEAWEAFASRMEKRVIELEKENQQLRETVLRQSEQILSLRRDLNKLSVH